MDRKCQLETTTVAGAVRVGAMQEIVETDQNWGLKTGTGTDFDVFFPELRIVGTRSEVGQGSIGIQ